MITKILDIVAIKPNLSSTEICNFLNVNLKDARVEFDRLIKEGFLLEKMVNKPNKYGGTTSTPVYVLGTKRLNIKKHTNSEKVPVDVKKVFVSHASNDKRLANKFIDEILIRIIGLNKKEDIFYTSDIETGIEPNAEWKENIRINLSHSKIFIALISERFKDSEMCLAELGAAWVLEKPIYQLAINPIKKNDCSKVLNNKQAQNLIDKNDLKKLIDVLREKLNINSYSKLEDKDLINVVSSLKRINKNLEIKKPKSYSFEETEKLFISINPNEEILYKRFSLITSEKKNYITIKTDFLKNDVGAFLVWIDYMGDENLNINSYIVSHASNNGVSISRNSYKYENVWAIKRTINKRKGINNWGFICSDLSCTINEITSERSLGKGNHLFTVSWNRQKQLISFYIDRTKIGEKPFINWPESFESKMTVGTWQSKDSHFYFNSKIGNIKVLNGIEVSDEYLDKEIKKFNKN